MRFTINGFLLRNTAYYADFVKCPYPVEVGIVLQSVSVPVTEAISRPVRKAGECGARGQKPDASTDLVGPLFPMPVLVWRG